MRHRSSIFIAFALSVVALVADARTVDAEKVTYETHVKPILREHCFACHNQDDATADLAFDSFDATINGGAGGEVLSAGDPGSSRLWKLVTHQEQPKMPPGDKLPPAQLDVLRKWIEGGLLNDTNSKPLKSSRPAITKIDSSKLGKPVGKPAMPEQLYHEPVLWAPKTGPVDTLATSPWAPLVAIGWQRQISFYHTDTHELLGIIPYVDGEPKVVRFSRDGSLVLVAGGRHAAAGSASLFDVKTGARLATLGDELDIVLAADISPDLSLVAIGGPKKKVRVFRVADGELAYQISKHTDWITAVGFSPDGKWLATADRNGSALIWQASAGHERADLRGHTGTITSLDWRADSSILSTASEDGTARLWNQTGKQINSITAHKSGVLSVRFAQDGNWVTTGRDRHVRTWKPDGAAIADLGKMSGITLAAAFTSDGKRVLASDYYGDVRVIDLSTKKKTASLPASPPALASRFAAAEKQLQRAKRKAKASKRQAKMMLAALDVGKAAHETHQAKLSKAESSLAEKRKAYEDAASLVEQYQQKLADATQSQQEATVKLAEARTALEQALSQSEQADSEPENKADEAADTTTSDATPAPSADQIAALKKQVELAVSKHQTAKQRIGVAQKTLNTKNQQQLVAQKDVEAAESLLAQVSNETTGLPDLEKLTESHAQAANDLAIAQQKLKQAEQTKLKIAAEQQRFAEATTHLSATQEKRQATQDQLAKQAGDLKAKHHQATQVLSAHSAQLTDVAKQLQAIQAKLAELQSAEAKLKVNEATLANHLREIQTTLNRSLQQSAQLEQAKRDLEAAEQLRKKYSTPE